MCWSFCNFATSFQWKIFEISARRCPFLVKTGGKRGETFILDTISPSRSSAFENWENPKTWVNFPTNDRKMIQSWSPVLYLIRQSDFGWCNAHLGHFRSVSPGFPSFPLQFGPFLGHNLPKKGPKCVGFGPRPVPGCSPLTPPKTPFREYWKTLFWRFPLFRPFSSGTAVT